MSLKRSLLTLSFVALASGNAVTAPLFQSVGEIPIGGEGGWDILTIDEAVPRLYLSHSTKVVARPTPVEGTFKPLVYGPAKS